MIFEIDRTDLHRCRVVDGDEPELSDGQARLAVDSFGLTANNITYAVFGDLLSYWSFFPAEAPWGRVPVWGFAEVVDAGGTGLAEGTRVFGYLPMASHLVVEPTRVDERGFTDGSPHRAALPPAYNGYVACDADPLYDPAREHQQTLLRPLFTTSFLIDDLLTANDRFGASAILLSSASSKTSIGTAHALAAHGDVEVVGLTSDRNRAFVEGLDVYHRVVAYDEVPSLPVGPAVFVDVAGDAAVRAAVHEHFGVALAHSAIVGGTHWDAPPPAGDAPLPGPSPTFFFAPDRVRARVQEWGQAELDRRLGTAWRAFVEWTDRWLTIEVASGPTALEHAYRSMLDGHVDPSTAQIFAP